MATWNLRSKRKPTGAKLRRIRKKRRQDRGSVFLETRVGEARVKLVRTRGGNQKVNMLSAELANLSDPKTGKITKTKVLSVTDNSANPHFVRRNVITKGAVIKTEAGLGRVTSRPGQDGIVNAVLVEEKK